MGWAADVVATALPPPLPSPLKGELVPDLGTEGLVNLGGVVSGEGRVSTLSPTLPQRGRGPESEGRRRLRFAAGWPGGDP